MNIAKPFIERPVATTLLVTSILIFGIAGYRTLPVSDLPTVDFPTIQVSAGLPGASPETMAASVATPLEKQFATIAGVTSMISSNTQGNTNITLQFSLSRDIDSAAADVQAMIARAARQLPQMPTPPSYNKVNPGDQPVIFLALRSNERATDAHRVKTWPPLRWQQHRVPVHRLQAGPVHARGRLSTCHSVRD